MELFQGLDGRETLPDESSVQEMTNTEKIWFFDLKRMKMCNNVAALNMNFL